VTVIRIVFRSPGILTMVDGPEHDGNSRRRRPVESGIFSFILHHVGSHVPTLSLNTGARCGHFHDVIHTRLVAIGPMLCPY